jgi:hypothetical protein
MTVNVIISTDNEKKKCGQRKANSHDYKKVPTTSKKGSHEYNKKCAESVLPKSGIRASLS